MSYIIALTDDGRYFYFIFIFILFFWSIGKPEYDPGRKCFLIGYLTESIFVALYLFGEYFKLDSFFIDTFSNDFRISWDYLFSFFLLKNIFNQNNNQKITCY